MLKLKFNAANFICMFLWFVSSDFVSSDFGLIFLEMSSYAEFAKSSMGSSINDVM